MAEPERKVYDDEGYDQPLSAEERANDAWFNNRAGMTDEELDAYNQGEGEALQSARERANQRWGMNGGTNKESTASDRPWAAPDSDNSSLSEREAGGGNNAPFGGDSESRSVEDIMSRKGAGGAAAGWATNMTTSAAAKSNPFAFAVSVLASNKRKALFGGGITGTIIGLFVFASMIASGPLKLIHAAQLLDNFHLSNSEEFGDSRRNNLFMYARNYAKGNAHRNNLGFFANQLADRYDAKLEKNGIKQIRDNRRSLQSLEIDTKTEAGRKMEANLREQGLIDGDVVPDVDGKLTIDTRGSGKTRLTRQSIDAALDAIGLDGKSTRVGRVVLRARNGATFHPFKNKAREKSEDYEDWRNKRREDRAKQQREGSNDLDANKPQADGEDTDKDGNIDSSDPEDVNAAKQAEDVIDELDDVDVDTVGGQGKIKTLKNNLIGRLGPAGTAAAGVAAVIGVSCAVKDVGNQVETVQYANKITPLVRRGVELAAAAGQAQAGQAHIDEIGEYVDGFYDEAAELAKDRDYFNAKSIQTENGNPNSNGPDISEEAKPSPPGEKDVVFEVLDNVPGLNIACNISDWVSGLPIVKQIGDASNAFISGSLEAVTGKSMDDYMNMLLNYLAGAGPNLLAQGAEAGNLDNIGTFLMNNEQMMTNGASELTREQSMELKMERFERDRIKNKQKSLYARLFDVNDAQSLVAKAVVQNPDVASISAASQSLTKIPSKLVNNVASIVSPRAHAANSYYDYGVPEYGFSAELRDNPDYADPFANADIVEPKLEELTEEYGECFDVKIETTSGGDNRLIQEESDGYPPEDMREKCMSSDPMLIRFRFYIADTMANKALVCLEGIDEKTCEELGYGSSGPAPTTSTGGGTTINGVECPPNMEEKADKPGYFKMPDAPGGEYTVNKYLTGGTQIYGSRQLVCVLYTVGMAYNEAMAGRSKLDIGDLNATGHQSHKWGVAVDLDARGELAAADHSEARGGEYSTEATITLGKLFVDTGAIKNIWWCERGAVGKPKGAPIRPEHLAGTDGTMNAIREYAESKGTPITLYCIDGHHNHFHVDIKDEYMLGAWEPS